MINREEAIEMLEALRHQVFNDENLVRVIEFLKDEDWHDYKIEKPSEKKVLCVVKVKINDGYGYYTDTWFETNSSQGKKSVFMRCEGMERLEVDCQAGQYLKKMYGIVKELYEAYIEENKGNIIYKKV